MFTELGSYWIWSGTIYLIILTFQDFLWGMKVDDRLNYLMIGLTISLASHYHTRLLYILIVIIVMILFHLTITKIIKNLGQGDLKAITWILTGYAIINIYYVPTFLLTFALIYCFYAIVKITVRRILASKGMVTNDRAPFFSIILLSFFTFSFMYGLY